MTTEGRDRAYWDLNPGSGSGANGADPRSAPPRSEARGPPGDERWASTQSQRSPTYYKRQPPGAEPATDGRHMLIVTLPNCVGNIPLHPEAVGRVIPRRIPSPAAEAPPRSNCELSSAGLVHPSASGYSSDEYQRNQRPPRSRRTTVGHGRPPVYACSRRSSDSQQAQAKIQGYDAHRFASYLPNRLFSRRGAAAQPEEAQLSRQTMLEDVSMTSARYPRLSPSDDTPLLHSNAR